MSESSGGPGPPDPFNMYNVVHRGEMPTLAESTQLTHRTPRHAYFTHPSDSEKYFVISGDAIRDMDIFDLHDELLAISKEKFKKTIRLQSGDVLVQTSNIKQIDALKATKTIGEDKKPVSVSENGVLNQSQAIIRCREIMKVDESRILAKLKEQKVTAVHRLKRRENGKWVDTPTHILTFNTPICPKEIDVGYLTVPTEVFIPAPFRCNICQKLGHTKKRCKSGKNKPSCAICGQNLHDFNYPCFLPKCINCNGPHPSYSKQCPRYIEEHEINATRVSLRIPYTLARDEVRKRRGAAPPPTSASETIPPRPATFSQVVASSTSTTPARKKKTSISQLSVVNRVSRVNRSQGTSRVSPYGLTNKAYKREIQASKLEQSNQNTTQATPAENHSKGKITLTKNIQFDNNSSEMRDISLPSGLPMSSSPDHPNSFQSTSPSPPPPLLDPILHPDPVPPDIEISDPDSDEMIQ